MQKVQSSLFFCRPESDINQSPNSDMHNPELAAKQILAITPIVKGQKESSQFEIPPHSRSSESKTSSAGELKNDKEQKENRKAPAEGNLIDL